jgi:hypothetical protein
MKKLNTGRMEDISGGKSEALDYLCGGVGTVSLIRGIATLAGASVALGPVGTVVGVGCGVYGLGKLFDLW